MPPKWELPHLSLSLSLALSFSALHLLEHIFENTYGETRQRVFIRFFYTGPYRLHGDTMI